MNLVRLAATVAVAGVLAGGGIAACSSDNVTLEAPTDGGSDATTDRTSADTAPPNPCGPGTSQCGSRCVDTALDPKNCGSCGKTCGDGEVCSNGTCGLTCTGGTTRCGDRCADTQHDPQNCGGCGTDAGANKCSSSQVCNAGACALRCASGFVTCNGGCIDPQTSRAFCGASPGCGADGGSPGTACTGGQVCASGTCTTSCLPTQVLCGGKCVDPSTDRGFCGATAGCGADGGSSGTACGSGEVCAGGTCATSCLPTQVLCGGRCVDPGTDRGFCGATAGCGADGGSAGTACGNGEVCSGGTCSASCASPLTRCVPDAGAPYCANTTSDPSNCGGCGIACPARPNATAACVSGSCTYVCNVNRADCNLQAADGCEIDISNDKNNCGRCANVCVTGTCTNRSSERVNASETGVAGIL